MSKHTRDVQRHWGLPVPPHIAHGSHRAAYIYGCSCGLCLPSGRRRQLREDRPLTTTERHRRSRENLRGRPVPPHVKHGIYAAKVYGCKCDPCRKATQEQLQRRRNAWRTTAHGVWTELPDRVILHWKPATAGEDWTCPDCGWAPESEAS